MDTIKYKINDNEFGYFIVNTETNKIIDLDKNSHEYKEYDIWTKNGNTPEIWNEGV
jgi:hypothetical protein